MATAPWIMFLIIAPWRMQDSRVTDVHALMDWDSDIDLSDCADEIIGISWLNNGRLERALIQGFNKGETDPNRVAICINGPLPGNVSTLKYGFLL